MNCTVANSLWLAGCIPEYRRFHHAVRHVEAEQQAILRRVLISNADTEFGRLHGFSSIRSAREYQERVPLREYEDFQGWIERIASGSSNVLTRDRVRLFEPTSGSSSASKLIPYTDSLEREFQAGIRAWIADLFLHSPELLSGPAYWSVSPVAVPPRKSQGEIPIGFEDDTSYVGGWQRHLVQAGLAVPNSVRRIGDLETFRYVTLLFLVRNRRLKLISVWNPTFLSLLVERLPEWGNELADDLERGTVRENFSLPHGLRELILADRRRADEIRAAIRANTVGEMHAMLWPGLRLISCWTDANAAGAAAQLAKLFPQARIQGKGLIATEGFVSFPIEGQAGTALAVRSHFLEFLPVDAAGQIRSDQPRLAHELDCGRQYSVVLTTGGGLYRYQLNDLVEVVGRVHECPLIRFLGRQGHVSDWFGEKLNEAHVSRILQDVFAGLGMLPSFAMLACETDVASPGYVLYIDTAEPDDLLQQAARGIEARLHDNFHYHYAREAGQLAAVRVFRAEGAAEAYLASRMRMGQRAGDIKPIALDGSSGWARTFRGQLCSESIRY